MVQRRFWQKLLDRQWRERSVVWLAGVRRVGKTVLCQSLHDCEYFDCELPRMRRMMENPRAFSIAWANAESCSTRFTACRTRPNY